MSYVGKETAIEVGGKRYLLARLDRGILRDFAQWAVGQLPDPLAVASQHLGNFPPDLQKLLVSEAYKDSTRRRDENSPEVQEVMNSLDGSVKMVSLLLAKHHPELSEEEAFEVGMTYFAEQVQAQVQAIKRSNPELEEKEALRQANHSVLSGQPFPQPVPALSGT